MPNKRTKEPTNKDIMNEVKRTHTITVLALFASVVVAGIVLMVSATFPIPLYSYLYGLFLVIIGAAFFIDALLRYFRRRKI